MTSLYNFSAKTGRLTSYRSFGISETLNYGTPENASIQSGQIFDITNDYNEWENAHYEYDRRGRLTGFWLAHWGRMYDHIRKITWTYDQYGNMTSMLDDDRIQNLCAPPGCLTQYTIDESTNRMTMVRNRWGQEFGHTYDSAGNDTGGGRTYDAENRLTSYGEGYLYDGHSRRLRRLAGTEKTYCIYSITGQLLVEDNWTTGAVKNQVYFNGQLVATHDQADYVRILFKDYLGSVRSVVEVAPGSWGVTVNWWQVERLTYHPFGIGTGMNLPRTVTPNRYTGKPLDNTGLTYFGARYYQGGGDNPSLRWISPDPITARIYDPLSLNKYSYVRNDPVNLVDPNGKFCKRQVDIGHGRYLYNDRWYQYDYIQTDISYWEDDGEEEGDGRGGGEVGSGGTFGFSQKADIEHGKLFERMGEFFDDPDNYNT